MDKLNINGIEFDAYRIPTANASLLAISAKNGMLACGYLKLETADKLGDALAIVTGVSCYDDMLKAEVKGVSAAATELGVAVGMSGAEALKKFF
jgi:uncharacterized protein YunC (DUF1805 family)